MSYENYITYLANRAVCCCLSSSAGATGPTGDNPPHYSLTENYRIHRTSNACRRHLPAEGHCQLHI